MKDKTIVCIECGKEFIHSVRDQEFYKENNWENEPKRCRDCRKARKARNNKYNNDRKTENNKFNNVDKAENNKYNNVDKAENNNDEENAE